MHNEYKYNKRIICVDDEEVMLETYRQVLGGDESDIFEGILQDTPSNGSNSPTGRQPGRLQDFDIVLARSGEEALRCIQDALAGGKRIAAGFFDMRMPGGIDGYETIRRARQLDSKILCAVVTAYTDRSVEQIAELFTEEDQDELLYFNKPFRAAELRQTAVNMICSWNRKRNEEEHLRIIEKNRIGLQYILEAVTSLMWIPPRPLQAMLSGILYQSLALIDSEDGYIGVFDTDDRLVVGHTLGKFKGQGDSVLALEDEFIKRFLTKKEVYIEDRKCIIPLVYGGRHLGLIYMESQYPKAKQVEEQILFTFGSQMVPLIMNSIFYDEIMKKKDPRLLTDPVTGLYDRQATYKKLQVELNRSSRFFFSVAVLMIDLDNLASINETYGKEAGVAILKTLAELIQQSVRGYDLVGRNVSEKKSDDHLAIHYREGGFTVILAQTDEKGASAVAERIRQNVEEHTFAFEGTAIDVTVSIGIGTDTLNREKLTDDTFPASLIQQADHPLSLAQTRGKGTEAAG
jgi:diguanylate cyclase (GGDEF)-like protein